MEVDNTPSPDAYYLMQIAAEIRRANVKKPQNVNQTMFDLTPAVYRDERPKSSPSRVHTSDPNYTAKSKQAWLTGVGILKNKSNGSSSKTQ